MTQSLIVQELLWNRTAGPKIVQQTMSSWKCLLRICPGRIVPRATQPPERYAPVSCSWPRMPASLSGFERWGPKLFISTSSDKQPSSAPRVLSTNGVQRVTTGRSSHRAFRRHDRWTLQLLTVTQQSQLYVGLTGQKATMQQQCSNARSAV